MADEIARPPLWRRTWFQVAAGIVLIVIALIMMGSAYNVPNAVAPSAPHSAPAHPAG